MTHIVPRTLAKTLRNLTARTSAAALVATAVLQPLSVIAPVTSAPALASERLSSRVTIQAGNSVRDLTLGLNKSMVVDLPDDAHDILVANPEVADAVTRTSRRIYLFGKLVGQTNIFVFNGQGEQIAALDIRIERDIAGLEEMITRFIPGSDVRAEMVNDNVVLTGSVANALESARAVSLAEIYVNGGEELPSTNPNTFFFGGQEESRVVNLLKIDGSDQVQLRVTVAEIQRSVVKQLGIQTNYGNAGDTDGFGFNVLGGGAFTQTPMIKGSGGFNLLSGMNQIQSQLSALEQAGVMRTLAEPSLTAISGEEANFKVGGNFNVAQTVSCSNEGTQVTFNQQEYGIALAFTPVVLSAGRISLKIHTEVNEPTSQGEATVCNQAGLPGLRQRLADTTVELPSGGSMVIAGLVQDDVRQTVKGYPGLKEIPVLGALFRSREFTRNESELVIVVTPYLVKPVARSQVAQPDENFQPASDAAGYFMGRVNRVYGTKQGNLPKGRYTGSIGFILK